MSPRGGGDRTPEQREAARRQRERRRLERAGEPIPYELLEPDEQAAAGPPPPPAHEPDPFTDAQAGREPDPFEPFAEEPAAREPEPLPPFVGEAAPDGPEPLPPFAEEPAAREPEPFAEQPAARETEPHAHEPHEPPALEPQPPAPVPGRQERAASHDDLQETQQWDVNEAWEGEAHAPPPAPPARDPEPPAAPAPPRGLDPEPPAAPAPPRERDPEPDPDATQAHDVLAWTSEHTAAIPPVADDGPVTGEHEEPLGTRRVSRAHLPNIHRPARNAKNRGDVPRVRRRGRGVRVKRPGEVAAGGTLRRRSAGPRIVALVVVVLAIVCVWFLNSLFQPFGGGDGSGQVVVTIPRGASAGDIGALLHDRGVISSSFFFGLRASVSGERSNLKSGTFRLRRDMGYGPALDALTKVEEPKAVPFVNVAIPEGRSRRETVAIARRAGLRGNYLTASRRSAELDPTRYGAPRDATLEGFLFPATYELNRGAKVQTLVDDQLRAFKQNFDTVNLRYAKSKRLTPFDVLTIASMVEREVSLARERPLVAAVIYNRLRDGIPLGIDATLRFEQNDWVNPLKQSVLDADTPYNTRTKQGLPPGPIGSPGLASIQAAARPANSRALYYVVKPGVCGEHAFSDTFEQFTADVAAYNAARERAGGKSPQRC